MSSISKYKTPSFKKSATKAIIQILHIGPADAFSSEKDRKKIEGRTVEIPINSHTQLCKSASSTPEVEYSSLEARTFKENEECVALSDIICFHAVQVRILFQW